MLDQKVDLGFFPTPLHKLNNLSKLYPDYSIYIKRDDQTGLASGGNKTRKLEYLLHQAVASGADTIITSGAQQSNHCRQTAAACAQLGLECHLLLGGTEPEVYQGNLLLSSLLGAEIHFCGGNRKGEEESTLGETLKAQGNQVYVIPYGGSNLTGALGFVNAMKELKKQLMEESLALDYIVFASSSGGMQAGITMGNLVYEVNATLIPISIDKEGSHGQAIEEIVLSIVTEGFKKMRIEAHVPPENILLNRNYDKDGYGVVTEKEQKAIATLAKHEGILLDPVYTGRAFYGMLHMLEQKEIPKGSRVLFWHTGGLPALFSKLKSHS